MDRFTITGASRISHGRLVRDPEGDLMRYEDHKQIIDRLRAENDALRKALKKYGIHATTCRVYRGHYKAHHCDCGLRAATISI